ncbi:MAG TPA: iron-responsive transcriptional regulator RirA [Afifellaceae bacterium]|nr:iron-responsive transcriptional regulator RirA [Afifellaceae bacterium]
MRLTRQTNYAVRILMYCAASKDLSRVADIAEFYGISEAFLFKILQALNGSGFLETVRGRAGGIRLAVPPEEIRLGAVIRAVEDNFALAECFDGGPSDCPLVTSCGFNEALSRALDGFFAVLDEYTIADLTNNRRNIHVLLQLDAGKDEPLVTN